MAQAPLRPSSRHAFRIAIICALPLEAEMVEHVFDRFWDDEGSTYGKAAGDQNAYTTGMIGNHNVVLAHMPEIGSNSAATLAAGLRSSFAGIEITFVVGICGVVPIDRHTKEEIVLGDCMISTAVVQYDFGRQYPQGFISKVANNSSGLLSTEIKSLISMLKTYRNRERLNKRLVEHLRALQKIRPDLNYPGVQRDRLFESSYQHQHHQGSRCDSCLSNIQICLKDCDSIGCADSQLIGRQRLQAQPASSSTFDDVLPQVHFGRFGSANSVLKSGLDRDRISEDNDLIAFEMEGSGVWNNFPTVLIKSACDYADSHKSKEWQPYAAATSAAGLKALLERWQVNNEVMEAEQQTSSAPSQYMIPMQRNKRFVGRESQLRELEDRLFIHKECQQLAIYGLGGVGKTQITLEFCYTVKAHYPDYSIFWISLISEARFKQDFAKVAKTCSLPVDNNDNVISIVQEYLSSEIAGKWLLIVDNVDDKKLILEETDHGSLLDQLPQSETGITLFNTRFKDIAFDVANGNIVNLDKMDYSEAKIFLSKSLQNDALVQDESLVVELLEELAYLPLAITQASSYMVKTSITVSKYLSLMRNTEEETVKLLSRDFRDHTRDKESRNAVAITWLVSFDRIRDEEPLAAEILFFISCIENKAIPLSILPGEASEIDRTYAIGVLTGYSFLLEQGNDMYDMHRLVHLAVKIWMQKRDLDDLWKRKAVSHLANVFPETYWESRALWRPYITHTIRLLQDTSTIVTDDKTSIYLCLAYCLELDGRLLEASIWMSDCVSLCKAMPEDNAFRMEAQRHLVVLLISNGRTEEAAEMMQPLIAMSERAFAEDRSSRLLGQHTLAAIYSETGQAHKAVEMIQKIIADDPRELGDDQKRLRWQHSLAEAYTANHQDKEAMELLQEIVTAASSLLEEGHPHRLAYQHALGLSYIDNGRGEDAIEILQKVVSIENEVLHDDSQPLSASHYGLARAYEFVGEIDKAISTMEYVVSERQKYLPATHARRTAAEKDLNRLLNTYNTS